MKTMTEVKQEKLTHSLQQVIDSLERAKDDAFYLDETLAKAKREIEGNDEFVAGLEKDCQEWEDRCAQAIEFLQSLPRSPWWTAEGFEDWPRRLLIERLRAKLPAQ